MSTAFTICHTCLSSDRALVSIKKLQDLLINVNLHDLIVDYEGGVCWECQSIIVKFSRFRKQVEFAQNSFHKLQLNTLKCLSTLSCSASTTDSYSVSDLLNTVAIIKQPVQLKQEINDDNDISEHSYNDNPLIESDIYIEENASNNQTNEIKCEADSSHHIYNQSFDETPSIEYVNYLEDTEIKVEIETVKDTQEKKIQREQKTNKKKTKKIPRLKKKILNAEDKQDYDDVKDKFVEVEFTEEEMMKSREEKRSHPNFKKLPYNCDSCVLGFTKKENYDLHNEKKHNKNIGEHTCPVCKVCFTSSASVSKHTLKHYHFYRCKLCTYETSELWSALSHGRGKHSGDSESSIHCKQCSFVAKSREELAEHARKEHALICNECGAKFQAANTLKKHERRVHGAARAHGCELCPRTFGSRRRLEAHARAHGPAAAARLAYCALCRVQYKNIYVYRNHLANSPHHSEQRYHCKECGKKFASKVYFKRHYTFYHQKESKFKCELCDQLFISDWRLRHHRQLRHGAERLRTHACDDCEKAFYTAATLRAHRLTHSVARSFLCAECGDSFRQRAALYTHARLVHRQLNT